MKKIIYLSLSALIFSMASSCSSDGNANASDDTPDFSSNSLFRQTHAKDVRELLTINATTDSISEFFFNLGAKSVEVSQSQNSTSYKVLTTKPFGCFDELVNFTNFEFIATKDKFYEKQNPDYYYSISNGEIVVVSHNSTLSIDKDNELGNSIPSSILRIFFNEVTNKTLVKAPFDELANRLNANPGTIPCTFMNTYYVVGVGLTTSAANSSLAGYSGAINGFTCTKLNTRTDLTDWGGFYTAVDTYCCPSCFPNCGGGGGW